MKAGTVLAAIFNTAPVCGFLPALAALFLGSKVPNPTNVTFLPFETVFSIVSKIAAITSPVAFCETFAF